MKNKERGFIGKVGERKIYYSYGDRIERAIKLGIQEAVILYRRDCKAEIGSINIYLKNGDWSICYDPKNFSYNLAEDPLKSIIMYMNAPVHEKDEKTGEYYIKEIVEWLIRDYGTKFKIITHNEIEIAEELIEPKVAK
ncbi:MAG: hypothetical protein ACPLX8_02140, partial [Nanopusillaceae archaeon]